MEKESASSNKQQIQSKGKALSEPEMANRKRPRANIELDDVEAKNPVPTEPAPEPAATVEPTIAMPDLNEAEQEQYREVLEAMKRFSERGTMPEFDPEGGENGTDEASKDATNAAKSATESTATKESEEKKANGTGAKPTKSRRQRKEEARNLIARLKALAERPDVVDAWDVTARDPLLLVHLKAWPNSVEVPANWRQKRKYLQNKRGMEKRAFQLPSYIADTGVGALRDAQLEADDKKTLKQKQREKMRAKTGKGVEIEDIVMHDAFFKFQTKPRLTSHGDLYYELRELEVDNTGFKPGVISSALRAALGMGPDDPPPWLINMQRFGPPPGYPALKIPGLNAPIPAGASFGLQPGGWGRPPVDPMGQPIYGDVFGEGREYLAHDPRFDMSVSDRRTLWGDIKNDIELYATLDDDEEEEDETKEGEKSTADVAPAAAGSASGVASIAAAPSEEIPKIPVLDTPVEGIELRKGVPDGSLYAVLPERKTNVAKKDMLGSAHVYDMSGTAGTGANSVDERIKAGDGTVNENPIIDASETGIRKRKDVSKDSEHTAKKQKNFKF